MRRAAFLVLAAIASAFLLLAAPAFAFDDTDLAKIDSAVKASRAELETIIAGVDAENLSEQVLSDQRSAVDKIKSQAAAEGKLLDQPQADVAAQLAKLGPDPQDGTAEAPEIASQRKILNDRAASLLGLRKQLDLLSVEADQHLTRLSTLERDQFLDRVFKSEKSVLDPRLWLNAAKATGQFVLRIGNLLGSWWQSVQAQANFYILFALLGVLAAIGAAAIRFLGAWSRGGGTENADQPRTQRQRLGRVIMAFLQLAVLTLLAAVALTAGLEASGLLTPQSNLLANGFINALVPAVLYTAAVYAVCQPGRPDLRLIAVETPAARTLVALMAIAATVYSFGAELTNIATALFIPFSFAVGSSAFTAIVLIVFIALALSVVRREARKNLATENGSYFLTWTLNFVPVLWGLLLIATLALVLGFIALGLFIAGNLLDTIVLAVLLGVIHAFVHALADESGQADRPIGHFLRSSVGWSESTVERFQLLFRTLTDIAVAILALLSLGGLWAVSLLDFTAFLRQAAEGFEIGSIAIHPIAILWAFFVLALGIVLTRYVTSWLQRRVLGATRLDKGAQDSIRTSVGYAGYAVAIAIALSVAGVGFSNLALIAGALGVGIGLGLQAITNNFVSGLILLAERPVRIGDWIVTPAGEGIVRRINVRSTEIETFDNSSIIIPNSNLITNAVRNWTLRDTMGHFNVSVAVAYDANPEAVQKDLATIASSHSMVMRHPPVTVMLVRLTSSAMEFDVSGQVRNVLDAAAVASDVRIEIAKTLGKKLLYIPNKAPAK